MSPAPPFNPNAPPVRLTGDDISAMRADMNKVAIKLHDATGIQLYGFYKIHDLVPYWGPNGFDFMCDNWRQLLDAADKNSRLGFDVIDMPGYDPWRNAQVESVGFTSIGKPPLVHLDVAIDRPGLCRVYVLEQSDSTKLDALRRAKRVTAKDSPVYQHIYSRLDKLGLDLDDHIGGHLEALRSDLDGVNFVAKDYDRLLGALTDLKYSGGDKVFFRGEKSARGHFVGNLSFLATDGIGFRQIWQTFPAERPVPAGGPAIDPKAAARFGDSPNAPDLTSLHCAVSKRMCNIHIDQMGFVIRDGNGNIIVDPDALRHIFVELLWKTNLQGKLPFWALDNVNLVIPSSANDFSRVGVSVDVAKFGRVSIQLNGTCAIEGEKDVSGTLTLGFRF